MLMTLQIPKELQHCLCEVRDGVLVDNKSVIGDLIHQDQEKRGFSMPHRRGAPGYLKVKKHVVVACIERYKQTQEKSK